jgi:hypothetical protein
MYLESFQRVPRPPKAPLAEISFIPPFFQYLLFLWRKRFSSNFVSWISIMFGFSVLIRVFMASSFILLPKPLQFQEINFIIYFCESEGLPWSPVPDFLPSLGFWPKNFPKLVGFLALCLCMFLFLSSPWMTSFPLSIFRPWIESLLFLLPLRILPSLGFPHR